MFNELQFRGVSQPINPKPIGTAYNTCGNLVSSSIIARIEGPELLPSKSLMIMVLFLYRMPLQGWGQQILVSSVVVYMRRSGGHAHCTQVKMVSVVCGTQTSFETYPKRPGPKKQKLSSKGLCRGSVHTVR